MTYKGDRPVVAGDGSVIRHAEPLRIREIRRSRRWRSDHPVEPGAGNWRLSDMPDPRGHIIPPPPPDDSAETQAELAELRAMTHNRTESDIAEILRWSVQEPSPVTHWAHLADRLCTKHKLSPPAGARLHSLLSQAVHGAMIASWANKFRYLRVRPDELDQGIDVSVIPVPQHPAYPSGHSTVAGAAAEILARIFPEDADAAWAMAEESGVARMKAGIHYRSDHTAGIRLGRRVARDLLKSATKDGAPQSYRSAP